MTKERFDIHQHITDKTVSAIERGAGNIMRPVNVASKKAYRGKKLFSCAEYICKISS
ncbi:MAG: hypothetical protein WBW81_12270 [Methylocella sp.]